jgi:hypothetical protein
MANIAFLGNFRVDYSTEFHHAASLQALGHNVIKLQETKATSEEILKVALESDLFVWVHTHGWNTPGDLSMARVLKRIKAKNISTMTYHLDLWLGLGRESDLDKDPVYKYIDHFFTVDKQMAQWLNNNTAVKGHYLQAGVYEDECYIDDTDENRNVIFVGSKGYHPEWKYRPYLIQWLKQSFGRHFEHWGGDGLGVKRGHELNKLYASAKVVVGDTLCINYNYPYYWSDRVYETIGRGGFIIHPYIKGMEEHFEDKKHLVFYEYRNMKQLKELVSYYLTHDEEREAIRKQGHEHVKQNHTYTNRWQTILQSI